MTMPCAMIDEKTGLVANIIMADPETDKPWPGHVLVLIPDDLMVDCRWGWNEKEGFAPAHPDLVEEYRVKDAETARVDAQRDYRLDDE